MSITLKLIFEGSRHGKYTDATLTYLLQGHLLGGLISCEEHHKQSLVTCSLRVCVCEALPEDVVAGKQHLKLPFLHCCQHGIPDALLAMTQGYSERPPGVELPLPVAQHACGGYNQYWASPAVPATVSSNTL